MSLQEVTKFLQAAFECSVYIAPREPGLTIEELYEAAKRAGLQEGEIGDALRAMPTQPFARGGKRQLPASPVTMLWGIFGLRRDPEYRKFDALDFVCSQMNDCIKAMGGGSARIERNGLVERAVAQNIPILDADAAITILVICGQLAEEDGQLRSPSGREYQPLPSQQRDQTQITGPVQRSEARERAYPIVKDVIGRRSDGRPKQTEPLDAFANEIDKLGYGRFRGWWTQTVAELRYRDINSTPVAASVLAAALVEGALTFVVKHAQNLKLGVMGSKDFDRDPTTWKIDDLVKSASAGHESAILDEPSRRRAEALIRARNRIHAGRMLSDFPSGVVHDLRPEEAREAKATADLVVRRVMDWLQRYPTQVDPSATT